MTKEPARSPESVGRPRLVFRHFLTLATLADDASDVPAHIVQRFR